MKLEYIIAKRTNGANPFKIFEAIQAMKPDGIEWAIKRMSYEAFLESAYWFAVSMVAKSHAGMRCQVCNSGDRIETHHRTYDTHGVEHLNMFDLVVLCHNCHGLFHGHGQATPSFIRGKIRIPRNTIIPHKASEVEIPDGESVVLTRDLIKACRANGSFTNATLRALGMSKATMAHGWVSRLIGVKLSRKAYSEAVEGKFHYKSGPLD